MERKDSDDDAEAVSGGLNDFDANGFICFCIEDQKEGLACFLLSLSPSVGVTLPRSGGDGERLREPEDCGDNFPLRERRLEIGAADLSVDNSE